MSRTSISWIRFTGEIRPTRPLANSLHQSSARREAGEQNSNRGLKETEFFAVPATAGRLNAGWRRRRRRQPGAVLPRRRPASPLQLAMANRDSAVEQARFSAKAVGAK